MRVAVTGASGFVGGAVCRAAIDEGWTVHAFGRRRSVDPGHVAAAPYRSWDITNGRLMDAPAVDVVIHCAGAVTDWGPIRQQWAVNYRGTDNVLASFPSRLVHLSTASVYDPYRPTVRAREDEAPVVRYVNAYGASKAAAERLVLRARPDAVVLRPHAVYGPGDTTLLPRVLSAIRHGRLLAVGDGHQLLTLTAVDNLVRACLLAAATPAHRGVFNVGDAEPIALHDVLTVLLDELRIRARITYLPAWLVRPLGTLAETAFRLAHRPAPPRLTRYAIAHLACERTLDLSAARERLGYDPTPTCFRGAVNW